MKPGSDRGARRKRGADRPACHHRPSHADAEVGRARARAPSRSSVPEHNRQPLPIQQLRSGDLGGGSYAAVLSPHVVDHLAWLLGLVLRFDGPADAIMSRFFKQHPRLGQRERGLIAEGCFHALRHYASLRWMMRPASPLRSPRLAALVTLARQHGMAVLPPLILRGDERAVRNALLTDLSAAEGAVRAELRSWSSVRGPQLFMKV